MARDFRTERDALVKRYYGAKPDVRNPRGDRSASDPDTIGPQDAYGLPAPINSPYHLFGHCLAWAYALNENGYGRLQVDGKPELVHRIAYRQTRGKIPEGKQVNHLCDRPYCFQPTHLYAGDQQDNRDDRTLFHHAGFMHAHDVARMGWPSKDLLLQRMRTTPRPETDQHWDPVQQPVRPTLEPFACPGHDYDIPMQGSENRICRICDATDNNHQFRDEIAGSSLIASMWPVSQASSHIFRQFLNSGITDPKLEHNIRQLAYRCHGFPRDTRHNPKDCNCHHCVTDRRAISTAVLPSLDPELRKAISLAETMRPDIRRTMRDAHSEAMRLAAQRHELDEQQTRILVHHIDECQTEGTTAYDHNAIEEATAAAAYCIATGADPHQMGEPDWRSKAAWALHHTAFLPGQETIDRLAGEYAKQATHDLLNTWHDQLLQIFPDTSGDPRHHELFHFIAHVITASAIFETVRYQATGNSSSENTWPAPHQSCAEEIARTGAWTPSPKMYPIAEGKGYRPELDDMRHDRRERQIARAQARYTEVTIEAPQPSEPQIHPQAQNW